MSVLSSWKNRSMFTIYVVMLMVQGCDCKSYWTGLEATSGTMSMHFSHFWLRLAVRMQVDNLRGVRAEGKGEVKRGCQRSRWKQAVGETDYLNEVWRSVSARWKISNVKWRGYQEQKGRVVCTTTCVWEGVVLFMHVIGQERYSQSAAVWS